MKPKKPFFSTKQYRKQSIIYIGLAILSFFLIVCGSTVRGVFSFGLSFGTVCGMILLTPGIYNLVCAIRYEKAAQTAEHFHGRVSNWELGFTRGAARICLNHGGTEYTSSAHFGHEEAKNLVGHDICYCILGETLFLLEDPFQDR